MSSVYLLILFLDLCLHESLVEKYGCAHSALFTRMVFAPKIPTSLTVISRGPNRTDSLAEGLCPNTSSTRAAKVLAFVAGRTM
jgi:hypothetical protein